MKIKLFTVPNLITLLNLLCGTLATLYAMRYDALMTAFWLIAAAAVFDFLDGFTARLTKSYSEIGKQLDSLSDLVSFGVAPSAILLSIYNGAGGVQVWGFAVFVLVLFSALRLAKFNIDESQSSEFEGLPTPASALFVAASGYLFANGQLTINPYYAIGVAICLSWFLVSHVRMFALKFHGFGFKENKLRYIFILCSAIAVIILKIAAIPFIIMAYILVSALRGIVCAKCRK